MYTTYLLCFAGTVNTAGIMVVGSDGHIARFATELGLTPSTLVDIYVHQPWTEWGFPSSPILEKIPSREVGQMLSTLTKEVAPSLVEEFLDAMAMAFGGRSQFSGKEIGRALAGHLRNGGNFAALANIEGIALIASDEGARWGLDEKEIADLASIILEEMSESLLLAGK